VQKTSYQLVTGLVKTYGLEKEGPLNHLLNQNKENTKDMPDNIDYNTFAFRDTTVEKFLNNMKAKNKPGKKRENSFEGPFGTGFVTKKPKTTA
jgi:hypothetical protein